MTLHHSYTMLGLWEGTGPVKDCVWFQATAESKPFPNTGGPGNHMAYTSRHSPSPGALKRRLNCVNKSSISKNDLAWRESLWILTFYRGRPSLQRTSLFELCFYATITLSWKQRGKEWKKEDTGFSLETERDVKAKVDNQDERRLKGGKQSCNSAEDKMRYKNYGKIP